MEDTAEAPSRGKGKAGESKDGETGIFGFQIDPNELVHTEKLYIERLRILLYHYHDPLKALIGTKKEILNEEDLRRVFNILPLLHSFHEKLHKDLQAAGVSERRKAAIASVLVKHAPYLRMYKDYVNNMKAALDFVIKSKSKKFKDFMLSKKLDPAAKNLDLMSLLVLPVHRLPQYKDLIVGLLERTETKDKDYEVLKKAADLLSEVTGQVNAGLKNYEDSMAKFIDENPKLKRKDKCAKDKKEGKKDGDLPLPTLRRKPSMLGTGTSVEREFSRSGQEVKTKADLFVEQFERTWRNAQTVVYKDLPRLVRRIFVRTPTGEIFQCEDKKGSVWDNVRQLVTVVAKELETKEKCEELEKALNDQNVSHASEIMPSLKNVFEKTLGLKSRTFSIFRTTHQSILVPAMVKLAETVFQPLGQNFKDVNRPDGWKIQIHIGEAIYVIHSRIEQSLHSPTDPLHFECEWSLRLSFDKKLEDLKAVFVRIIDVKTHPEMPKDHKDKVLEALKGEGYLIS